MNKSLNLNINTILEQLSSCLSKDKTIKTRLYNLHEYVIKHIFQTTG